MQIDNMDLLLKILDGIIYVALFFALIEVYLKVNKIWKRKHEEQVAQSQSLLGLGLSFFILIIWTIKYIIIGEYTSIVDNSIYLSETIVMMMIGTGIFVKENRGLSFIALIKKSISLERKEATYLIKAISGKEEALDIINILHQLAWIDDELDDKESILINEFAKAWNIDYDSNNQDLIKIHKDFDKKLKSLRSSMVHFLDSNPNKEQIAQLTDLLEKMINADEKTSKEEEIIFDELNALMQTYLNDGKTPSHFHVLIVPQEQSHTEIIKQLKPNAKEYNIAGGIAFSLEKYLSKKYAEEMCEDYRGKGLFTIVQEIDEDSDCKC